MSRKRALSPQLETELADWFKDYERIGSLADKCRQLGIVPRTAHNVIARLNGTDTTYTRQKIAELTAEWCKKYDGST